MLALRRFFTRNWLIKLFSLLLATMLWIMISSETASEIGMVVPLEYRNIPPQLEVVGDAENSVEVRLRGSSGLIKEITSRDISATLDLGGMAPGDKIVQLTAQNVKTPFGIEVVRVNPSRVRLTLDRTMSKTVPVVLRIEGSPVPGFAIGEQEVSPATVEIEGPESKVQGIELVSTAPVRVNGRDRDFSETVDVDIADPMIRLRSSGRVEIRIGITEDNGDRPKHQRQPR